MNIGKRTRSRVQFFVHARVDISLCLLLLLPTHADRSIENELVSHHLLMRRPSVTCLSSLRYHELYLKSKGNVFKNKRVLIEYIHKQRDERNAQRTLQEQADARRLKTKQERDKRVARVAARLANPAEVQEAKAAAAAEAKKKPLTKAEKKAAAAAAGKATKAVAAEKPAEKAPAAAKPAEKPAKKAAAAEKPAEKPAAAAGAAKPAAAKGGDKKKKPAAKPKA